MCHSKHSRSSTIESATVPETSGETSDPSRTNTTSNMEAPMDDISSSSSASSELADGDDRSERSHSQMMHYHDGGGVYAFNFMKRNAEVQRLKTEEGGGTMTRKQQRNLLLTNAQDCFSLSSLEIDLDDSVMGDYDIDDDDDDDALYLAASRFSARACSRRGSMDFTPALPMSSSDRLCCGGDDQQDDDDDDEDEQQQQLPLRKLVSQCELNTRWQSESPVTPTPSSPDIMMMDDPHNEETSSLRESLRDSRWSSSSERSEQQDALDVLLDKVSFREDEVENADDDGDVDDADDEALYVDAAAAMFRPPTRRLSMDSLTASRSKNNSSKKQQHHAITTNNFAPILPRRSSAPAMDRRWEVPSSLSSQKDSLRSPMRFRG